MAQSQNDPWYSPGNITGDLATLLTLKPSWNFMKSIPGRLESLPGKALSATQALLEKLGWPRKVAQQGANYIESTAGNYGVGENFQDLVNNLPSPLGSRVNVRLLNEAMPKITGFGRSVIPREAAGIAERTVPEIVPKLAEAAAPEAAAAIANPVTLSALLTGAAAYPFMKPLGQYLGNASVNQPQLGIHVPGYGFAAGLSAPQVLSTRLHVKKAFDDYFGGKKKSGESEMPTETDVRKVILEAGKSLGLVGKNADIYNLARSTGNPQLINSMLMAFAHALVDQFKGTPYADPRIMTQLIMSAFGMHGQRPSPPQENKELQQALWLKR